MERNMTYFITGDKDIAEKLSKDYILISEVLKDFLKHNEPKDFEKLDQIYGKVYIFEEKK